MRTKTGKFYETAFSYDQLTEQGVLKMTTENYVVEAQTFADAEARVVEEMSPYVSGEYEVSKMAIAPFREIWMSDMEADDRYFKAKLQYITIDEKTEKEKKQTICYLVQAKDFDGAKKAVEEVMSKTMVDYVIASITETRILDVYEAKQEVQ